MRLSILIHAVLLPGFILVAPSIHPALAETTASPSPHAGAKTNSPMTTHTITTPIPGTPEAEIIAELIQLDPLLEALAEEGHKYGADVGKSLFGFGGGLRWRSQVKAAYAPERLKPIFMQALAQSIYEDTDQLAQIVQFYESNPGDKIPKYELEARKKLMDEAEAEAAQVQAEKLRAEQSPRMRQIQRIITEGDLIEMNVISSMNALIAFDQGVASAAQNSNNSAKHKGFGEIWAQESNIRADSASWLMAYFTTASEALTDQELRLWADFSASDAAKSLNRAISSGMDAAQTHAMTELGRAAGMILEGDNI